MSNVDYEIEWLRHEIIPQLARDGKLLDNFNAEIDINALKIKNISVKFIGAEEAFMLTICYRATIEFAYHNVDETLHIVVKKTPKISQELYDSFGFNALFSNEIVFYTKVLPRFNDLAPGTLHCPKFYYAKLENSSATIILSNFQEDGYRMSESKVNLSIDHILLGVQNLGTFHGIAYAFKHKHPEIFKQLMAEIKEPFYVENNFQGTLAKNFEAGINRLYKATRQYEPAVSEEFLQHFQKVTSNMYEYGRQRVQPNEPLAVLCHGDYLRNNVAYKYEDDKIAELATDIIVFDYQRMRYASPMLDLATFLMLSSFAELRTKNFDTIFKAYCVELGRAYIQFADEPVPEYLKMEPLLKAYILHLPCAIGISSFFLNALVEPHENKDASYFIEDRTPEDIIDDVSTRGGVVTDRELAHQTFELYEFCTKHKIDITEGINMDKLEN